MSNADKVERLRAKAAELHSAGQLDEAVQCYQRILETYPNHPRARLYLKDVNASRDMFYDEDEKRRRDRLSQVMNVPVTDFELYQACVWRA